jgi:Rps23 Pro-64 3,4-dihydroxylase Tpa1-like proline 4-hydroxylase
MIKVIDNQLPENFLLECIGEAEKSSSYSVLHKAGDGSYGFKYSWMFCDVLDNGNIKNYKIKELWEEIQKHLPANIRLHRGYINAHTYGVEDAIHVDDGDIKKGLTVIVYLCNDWYPEWFGQTMFFESIDKHKNEITKSVLPKFNRALIFDKNIPHCVSPLSRKFLGVRLTCMFKVELLDEPT